MGRWAKRPDRTSRRTPCPQLTRPPCRGGGRTPVHPVSGEPESNQGQVRGHPRDPLAPGPSTESTAQAGEPRTSRDVCAPYAPGRFLAEAPTIDPTPPNVSNRVWFGSPNHTRTSDPPGFWFRSRELTVSAPSPLARGRASARIGRETLLSPLLQEREGCPSF